MHHYNLGQNIIDKSTKLSNIGFSVECFTADFLQFCSTTVKTFLLGGRVSTFPSNLSILGISYVLGCSATRQVISLFGDNNIVAFALY